jgi:hypothetical protein
MTRGENMKGKKENERTARRSFDPARKIGQGKSPRAWVKEIENKSFSNRGVSQ